MEIRSLVPLSLESIVSTLTEAFSDYIIPMNRPVKYWRRRWNGAGVNWDQSYGLFAGERLVAFLIHGIGEHEGVRTAYNTGTGVVPDFRGRRMVQQLYDYACPRLQAADIRKVMLEVITSNEKAIKAYHGVGFGIDRTLRSFAGDILFPASQKDAAPHLEPLSHPDWSLTERYYAFAQPWDHRPETIERLWETYSTYRVLSGDREIGYFIIDPETGYLAQFGWQPAADQAAARAVLGGIREIKGTVRVLNVDASDEERIQMLRAAGLQPFIDQYEMSMRL